MPAAQACCKSLAEHVDANDRAFRGVPMAARVASHAPECTELAVEGDRGFGRSVPLTTMSISRSGVSSGAGDRRRVGRRLTHRFYR
jgi:hypothetical protein